MGLLVVILGLVVFIGLHVLVSLRHARAGVIARLGEGLYKGLFSLGAILGVALIAYGFGQYRAAGVVPLWNPPAFMRHITIALMLPSVVCVAAAYIPGHIKMVLKHPMLVGVKLWALAHLLSNGDFGGIVLFGSILGWAVYDRISLKRRTDPGGPNIPTGGWRNDAIALAVGAVVFLALGFAFHPIVIGIPVFGR